MKKSLKALLCLLALAMLSGCGRQTDPSSQTEGGAGSNFVSESGLGSVQWTAKDFIRRERLKSLSGPENMCPGISALPPKQRT